MSKLLAAVIVNAKTVIMHGLNPGLELKRMNNMNKTKESYVRSKINSIKKRFLKWNRRRRFIHAYRILRNEAERHNGAGHHVIFSMVNEAQVTLVCVQCPCLQPYAARKVII